MKEAQDKKKLLKQKKKAKQLEEESKMAEKAVQKAKKDTVTAVIAVEHENTKKMEEQAEEYEQKLVDQSRVTCARLIMQLVARWDACHRVRVIATWRDAYLDDSV